MKYRITKLSYLELPDEFIVEEATLSFFGRTKWRQVNITRLPTHLAAKNWLRGYMLSECPPKPETREVIEEASIP